MTTTFGEAHDRQLARVAIEGAIAILKLHRPAITEGQFTELRRIIYNVPKASEGQ